jgi:hypothetical protein
MFGVAVLHSTITAILVIAGGGQIIGVSIPDSQAVSPVTAMKASVPQPIDTGGVSVDSAAAPTGYAQLAADSSWWYREVENRAFGVGELLEFDVKYGKLPAGSATLAIPEIVNFDGRDCYRVTSNANSNGVVSVFYKVRDHVESFIDVDGLFPRKFHKSLREGGYKADRTTVFNQKEHLAVTGNDTIPTYSFVQDPLSSLYYVRTQELIPGKDVLIDNHTDKKNYPLRVIVHKKETIEVPAGKFDCIVVEPVMRAEGIFKAKGSIKIWLTDDACKMPVLMKTEVFFLGSISAQLSKYTPGQIEVGFE